MNTQFKLQYPVDEHFFDVIEERQAWLLGLLAADGCVTNGRLITLNQSGDHGLRLIRSVQKMIGHNGCIYTNKNAHIITFTSKYWAQNLARFGVVERKTLVFTFPMDLHPDMYSAFLRGYIDGDGSVGVYQSTHTETLVISFVGTSNFIHTCQEISPIKGRITAIKRAANLAEFRCTGRTAIRFGNWIWSSDRLPFTNKQQPYRSFIATHGERLNKYTGLKARAYELFDNGASPMLVAETLQVPFQTIYKWRNNRESI